MGIAIQVFLGLCLFFGAIALFRFFSEMKEAGDALTESRKMYKRYREAGGISDPETAEIADEKKREKQEELNRALRDES